MPDQPLPWFRTEEREGRTYVFDPLRRRQVVLTPEEEVRQKVLYLLVEHLKVPAGLVAVEYSLKVNGLDKRADAVVFGQNGQPLMIVECKAPTVTLTEAVLDQAVRYYSAFIPPFKGVPEGRGIKKETQPEGRDINTPQYILITNGSSTYCFKAVGQQLHPMDHLPDYAEMKG